MTVNKRYLLSFISHWYIMYKQREFYPLAIKLLNLPCVHGGDFMFGKTVYTHYLRWVRCTLTSYTELSCNHVWHWEALTMHNQTVDTKFKLAYNLYGSSDGFNQKYLLAMHPSRYQCWHAPTSQYLTDENFSFQWAELIACMYISTCHCCWNGSCPKHYRENLAQNSTNLIAYSIYICTCLHAMAIKKMQILMLWVANPTSAYWNCIFQYNTILWFFIIELFR